MDTRNIQETKIYYLNLNPIGSADTKHSELVVWSFYRSILISWIKLQECKKYKDELKDGTKVIKYFNKGSRLEMCNQPMFESQGIFGAWLGSDKMDEFTKRNKDKEIRADDIDAEQYKFVQDLANKHVGASAGHRNLLFELDVVKGRFDRSDRDPNFIKADLDKLTEIVILMNKEYVIRYRNKAEEGHEDQVISG